MEENLTWSETSARDPLLISSGKWVRFVELNFYLFFSFFYCWIIEGWYALLNSTIFIFGDCFLNLREVTPLLLWNTTLAFLRKIGSVGVYESRCKSLIIAWPSELGGGKGIWRIHCIKIEEADNKKGKKVMGSFSEWCRTFLCGVIVFVTIDLLPLN